jgi:hypothetical protein
LTLLEQYLRLMDGRGAPGIGPIGPCWLAGLLLNFSNLWISFHLPEILLAIYVQSG